jgi:hypothetical protein
VKLYADEPGERVIRSLDLIVVSCLARVEVPAAIWRKCRQRDLSEADADVLVAEFEADYFGTSDAAPRFLVTGLPPLVLDEAARLVASRALRAYDAVRLASACAARDADRSCSTFACADRRLRAAAAAEGFELLP